MDPTAINNTDRQVEVVFATEWFSIEREAFDGVRDLGGEPFYRFKAPDSVIVLATTSSGEIVLVRQFRLSTMEYTLEMPAGFVDTNESGEVAAARELYEETGYRCESLEYLGPGRQMMNRTESVQHGYLGRGAVRDPDFQPQEDLEVMVCPPDKLKKMILEGQFQQLAGMALIGQASWKLGHNVFADA